MSDVESIRLPERGHCFVNRQLWERLSASEEFWQLIKDKRLSVTQQSQERVRLDGTCYVGRALINGVSLELVEKVDGALDTLLAYAGDDTFLLSKVTARTSDLGDRVALLIREFLRLVRRYVSGGRDFYYGKQPCVSSLVGGSLNLTRTIALRARGLSHLVAFDRNAIYRNTPKNRIIRAALREVERINLIIPMRNDDLILARSLALLFDDCRDAQVLFGRRGDLLQMAEMLRKEMMMTHEDRELLSFAGILLAHESFEHTTFQRGSVPRAWFMNLENLFQHAVLRVVRQLCRDRLDVKRGESVRPPLFAKVVRRYRANPDLVFDTGDSTAAIGDIKYKTWDGYASEDDLYQLLAHAAAFNTNRSFLLYPSDQFETISLGKSATGCETLLFAVNIRQLETDLKRVLTEVGL